MSRNLGQRDTPIARIASNQQGVSNEEQKPVLGGPKIFVGDFIGPGDPGNDPAYTSVSSPPYQNSLTYMPGYPIWFAHGVDGETDMGGMYDLFSGYVSGDLGFEMPLEWAAELPVMHAFPVKLDEGLFTMAIQECTIVGSVGEIRIWWPICADLCVT